MRFMVTSMARGYIPTRFANFKGPIRRDTIIASGSRNKATFLCPFMRSITSLIIGIVNQFIRRCNKEHLRFRADRRSPHLFSATRYIRKFKGKSISRSPTIRNNWNFFFSVPIIVRSIRVVSKNVSIRGFVGYFLLPICSRNLNGTRFVVLPRILERVVRIIKTRRIPQEQLWFSNRSLRRYQFTTPVITSRNRLPTFTSNRARVPRRGFFI